jgi:hypothetical protein
MVDKIVSNQPIQGPIPVPGTFPESYPSLPDKTLDKLTQRISAALARFQQEVYLVTDLEKTDCPDCDFDPISGTSTDPNCETCNGTGKVSTEVYTTISAVREVVTAETLNEISLGALEEGDVIISISTSELARTGISKHQIENMVYLRTAESVVVDEYGESSETEITKWKIKRIISDMLCDRLLSYELICRQWDEGDSP